MGGGNLYPSAATVHEVIRSAQTAESNGDYIEAIRRYREAAELLLILAKNKAISEDERYALETQSRELTVKANALENFGDQTARAPKILFAEPVSRGNSGVPQPVSGVPGSETDDTAPETDSSKRSGTSETVGAAAVGAASGLAVGSMLGIPLFGMVAGGAAGGFTAQMDNEYGIRARKYGKYGAKAIDSTKEFNQKHNVTGNAKVAVESAVYKAKMLNEKHDITGNVKRTAEGAYVKAKELNEKHDVTGKAKKAAESTLKAANDFNKKYKVTDTIGSAVASGFQALNKAFHGQSRNQNQNQHPNQ